VIKFIPAPKPITDHVKSLCVTFRVNSMCGLPNTKAKITPAINAPAEETIGKRQSIAATGIKNFAH
jgi:hypothetical protein